VIQNTSQSLVRINLAGGSAKVEFLLPGTYMVLGSAPAYKTNESKSWLEFYTYNGATAIQSAVAMGTNAYSGSAVEVMTRTEVHCVLEVPEITAPNPYIIFKQFTGAALAVTGSAGGLGKASSAGAVAGVPSGNEIYARLFILKLR
jgi:hypothetical protein